MRSQACAPDGLLRASWAAVGAGLRLAWLMCSNGPMDDGNLTNDIPVWWPYPMACAQGHPWGPGKVIVAFRRCTCVGDEPGKGHTVVYCRVEGCQHRWCTPAHDPRFGAVN